MSVQDDRATDAGHDGQAGEVRPDGTGALPAGSQALLDAVIALGADLDVHRVLDRIVASACVLTGARYGALGVIAPDGSISDFITHGVTVEERAAIGPPPQGRGMLHLLIREPTPIRLHRLQDHASSYGFPPNHPPMTSFLGVPVRIRGTVFGNLYLTEKAEGADFTQQDEDLVLGLASAAGFVIENARAYAVSERQRRWLEAAARLHASVQPDLPLDEALEQVAVGARMVSGARAVGVLLEEDDTVRVAATDGPAGARVAAVARHHADDVRRALTGSEVLVPLHAGDEQPRGDEAPQPVEPDQQLLLLPLGARLLGRAALLVLLDRDVAAPGLPPGHQLMRSYADQAALTLDRAQGVRDRESLAILSDRERIATDLHDVVIQRLFAAGLMVQGLLTAGDASTIDAPAVLRRVAAELDTTVSDIRSTIFELQQSGSSTTLRGDVHALAKDYARVLGFTPAVRTAGPIDTVVPSSLRDQVTAVVREALSNAARHAHASHVWVELDGDVDRLVVRVGDDGVGLPDVRDESGLGNLRRRAERLGGTFEAVPREPSGTEVRWTVPLR